MRKFFQRIKKKQLICLYTICVTIAGLLFADAALAQAGPAPAPLDLGFVLRTLLGVLIAIIAYYTRGVEKRVEALEHDNKQLNSAIGLIREQIYRDYENKTETQRKWEQIELSLQGIRNRLDYMARPQHRRSDDENDEGAGRRGR